MKLNLRWNGGNAFLLIVFLFILNNRLIAQISNLKYETYVGTYTALGSSKTQLIAGGSAFTAAATANIGFNFNFQGKDYTTFGAGATGSVALGAAPSNTSANDIALATAAPKLMPYWDYNTVGTAATNGGVFYELSGTSPNRVLTIQFNLVNAATTAATNLNFQVKLYESSNKIEYVYGAGTTTSGASIGLAGLAATYEYMCISTPSHNISRYSYHNVNTDWPGAGRVYSFTPTSVVNNLKLTNAFGDPILWYKADPATLNKYTYTIVPSPAANRTSSSVWASNWTVTTSELSSTTTAWIASSADGGNGGKANGWIQLDLGSVKTVDGLATLGAAGYAFFVSDFFVSVSSDGTNYTNLGLFNGNQAADAIHYADFDAPVTCRYIKVYPGGFTTYRAMRLDAYTKTNTTVTDGAKFSQIQDQSGNKFYAQQPNDVNQEVFKINQLNFNPAIVSTNTGTLATSSWYDFPDALAIRNGYWVAQDYTAAGGTYNSVLFSGSGRGFQGGASGTLNINNVGTWRKNATTAAYNTAYDFGPENVGKPNLISSQFTTIASPGDALTQGYQAGYARTWNGPIGEIILFNNVPTYQQSSEIETYLAIKYGISKGDWYIGGTNAAGTAATTTLFATSSNAPYNQNIFGIGRNDTWGLHQRQSKSVNTFDFFWVGNNNIVDNTIGNDASVGNDIGSNNSYLLMGDDNARLAWSRTASVLNKRLLGRTWNLTETGSIGSVKLSFAANESSNTIKLPYFNEGLVSLVVSSNTNFNDGLDRVIDLSFNTNNQRWEGNVDFAPGENYFTLAVPNLRNPGMADISPKLWFGADMPGVLPTTTWQDLSGNAGDVKSPTGITFTNPNTASQFLNYNPTYSFNGTSQYFTNPNFPILNQSYEKFIVMNPTAGVTYPNAFGFGTNASSTNFTTAYFNSNKASISLAATQINIFSSLASQGYWQIFNGGRDYALASNNTTLTSYFTNSKSTGTGHTTLNPALDFAILGGQRASGTNTNLFKGQIAEVLYYDQALTNTQKNKIRSYLAIKYGMSLDHDYVSGLNSTIVWSISGNTGYNNNIFGIGREDNGTLHQRQSMSVSGGGVVSIGNNRIIDQVNGNSSLAGNDVTNGTFEMIGDNAGLLKFTTIGAPGAQNLILSRVWKVQETGTVGDIKIAFASGRAGTAQFLPNATFAESQFFLTTSTNTNFADGDPLIPMTFDGKYWSADVNLANGTYFTVVKGMDGPGCLDIAPVTWFRADIPGANPTTVWEDQSGNVYDVTAPNTVTFTNPLTSTTPSHWVNFNPSYAFNGTTQYLSNGTNFAFTNGSQDHFAVANNTAAGAYRDVFGMGRRDGTSSYTELRYTPTGTIEFGIAPTWSSVISTPVLTNSWNIIHSSRNSTGNSAFIQRNGTSDAATGTIAGAPVQDYLNIGARRNTSANDFFMLGNISEVISYDQVLTVDQRNRVRTYLGIKYGTTLNHNYVGGDGTILWNITTNAGYNNNIFGIGREDCQFLHQRQSKSTNSSGLMIIGNNNIIGQSNNASFNNNLSTDKSYLVVGDDNGEISFNSALVGDKYLLNRTWKFNETGTVGSVKISLPANGNASCATTLPAFENSPYFQNNTLYLLQDDDGNFTNGGTTSTAMSATGTGTDKYYSINVDLSNAKPFIRFGLLQNTTDSDADGVLDFNDLDDDNDGVLDNEECPMIGTYKVYTYNRVNDQAVSSNVPIQIIGKSTVSYTLDQKTNGVAPNNFTYNGVSGWKLMASGVSPDINNKIQVKIVPTASTNGSYVFADAMLVTNGMNTYVIDNSSASNTNFVLTGANWIYQATATSYDDGGGADNTYVAAANYASNSVAYNFFLPAITCLDTDADGTPNYLDLDSDGDGCNDAVESRARLVGTTVPLTGTFGANGFLDALETNTESGQVNYVSKYTDAAIVSSIVACLDTDGDGVANYFDLDDDNDGVLDTVECAAACSNPITNGGFELPNIGTNTNSITSTLTGWSTTATDGMFEIWGSGFLGKTAGEGTQFVELNAYQASSLYQKLCLVPGSVITWSVKHRGRDGVDVAEVQFGSTVAGATTVQSMSDGAGSWGTYTGTYTIPANQADTYIVFKSISSSSGSLSSGNLLDDVQITVTTPGTCDTDGDGLSNTIDPDSDNDGCNDAIEGAGYPLGTSVPVAGTGNTNYGLNGFVNAKETSAESGVFNNFYSYFLAKNSSYNLCLDTDGDGLGDLQDIDDDNDGVLDLTESISCSDQGIDISGLSFNGSVIGSTTINSISNINNNTVWGSSYSDQVLKLPITLRFKADGSIGKNNMFGLISTTKTQTLNNWADAAYKFYITGGNVYGYLPSQWTFSQPQVAGEEYQITIDASGKYSAWVNGVLKVNQTQGVVSDYRLVSTAYLGPYNFTNIVLNDNTFTAKYQVCNDQDTDADGIPNRLDLDSDNDGCSDAKEGGATTSTALNYKFIGNVGTNGLVNTLETVADNGTINYETTYSWYAKDKSVNVCADTDGDGVTDIVDLDDDNDGVLDTEESTCYNPSLINFTNLGTTAQTYSIGSGNNVRLVSSMAKQSGTDGNGNLALYNLGTATLSFDKPVILKIKHANNTTVNFDTGDKWKIDGNTGIYTVYDPNSQLTINSNDLNGVVFTPKATANNDAENWTITTGKLSTVTFTLLIGNTFSDVNVELVCDVDKDTDGDGIPNRLDSDSDGDGCNDAVEAGVVAKGTTVPIAGTTASNYGANGFVNSKETGTESGVYNGTYKYTFATNATINLCIDTDNDGVPDYTDVDDDNDGILDTEECPPAQDVNIIPRFTLSNGSSKTSTITNWPQEVVLKLWALDNNFNLKINGTNITTKNELNFYLPSTYTTTTETKVTLQNGSGVNGGITWTYAASNPLPLIKVVISNAGLVKIYGKNGSVYEELKLASATMNTVPINVLGTNTIVLGQNNEFAPSGLTGEFSANQNFSGTCDTDGDGIPNHLDLDSDNDGCSDATEYYQTNSAIGTDGNNYYGTGNPPTVDATGKVVSAAYSGNYTMATTVQSLSTVTTQPTNAAIQVASNATFTAAVTAGSGTTSYVWQVSSDAGLTWTDLTNTGVYSGATTTTLTLTAVPITMQGYRYRMVIKQSTVLCKVATTNAAKLVIGNVPNVTDDNASGNEDTPISGSVLTNDAGSGGSTISLTNFIVGGATYLPGQTASIPNVGTVKMNANGTYVFTPAANYNGTVPDITYTATDTNNGTDTGLLSLVVNPVNDPPLVKVINSTNIQYTSQIGSVLTGSSDVDGGNLLITNYTFNGQALRLDTLNVLQGYGKLQIMTDGTYNFLPDSSFVGTVPPVTFTVSDTKGGLVNSTLNLKVTASSVAPPSPTDGTYVAGDNTNPADISNTVPAAPVNQETLYCDANGANCSTSPPALPMIPGIYVYCIKYRSLITNVESECAIDTIRIRPAAPVPTNGTYTLGAISNPTDISSTVPAAPSGQRTLYCDSQGNNCSTTPPAIPTTLDQVTYCVKYQDIATGLISDCGYDVITMLPRPPVPLNGTYVTGANGNPTTIAPTVPAAPSGQETIYCDASGTNCSTTVPALPSVPGRYIFCIKYKMTTAPFSESTPCVADTIIMKPVLPTVSNVAYCQNATAVALTATPGAGGTLKWYTSATGGTGSSTAPTPSTTYPGNTLFYVTQTINSIESNRAAITVTVNALPAKAQVSLTQPTCSLATGTITVTSTGVNTDTYSIDGSTYQSSTIFTAVTPGTYGVTLKSATGCVSPATSAVINAQPAIPPVPTISSSGLTVCAGTALTLTSSASSGNQWFKDGSAINGATGTTLNVIASGAYTVTATSAAGCSTSSVASTVTISALPTASLSQGAGMNYANCATTGPTITLTASTNASLPTYAWYQNGSLISGTNSTLTTSSNGLYTVRITDGQTGCVAESLVSNVTAAPSINGGQSSICNGDSFTFTANATGAITWEFSADGNSYSTIANQTSSSLVATNAGFYRVTDAGVASCPAQLLVNAFPTVSITSNPGLTVCSGTSTTLTASATASGSATISTYQWAESSVKLSGATSTAYSTGLGGDYKVRVTDSKGCSNLSTASKVTVNALPASATSSITQPTCSVGTGTITATAPIGAGYQYSLDGNNYQSSVSFAGKNPGTYSIYVKDSNGCVSTASSAVVSAQPQVLAISGSITGNNNPTAGSTEVYAVSPVNGAVSYVWTIPNSWSGSSSSPSITAITAVGGTNVSVAAVSADGCVGTPVTMSVTSVVPAPSVTGNTLIYCEGATATSLVATASAGASLNWYTTSSGGTASSTAPIPSTSQAGNTTYYVSQTLNGQESARASIQITVNARPAQAVVTLTQATCSVATGTISVTSTGVNTDTYSINGTTYQSNNVFSSVQPGTYSVTIKNINGCVSTATAAVLSAQPATPTTPTVTLIQATCTVATGTITVVHTGVNTDTYSIDGTNYQASKVFNNVVPGTYSVTVKSANGCISSATAAVLTAQPTSPATPTVTLVQATCSVATGTITVSSTGVNTDTYSIDGTSYQSSNIFNTVQPGTYSIKVKSANGCLSTATSVVLNTQPITPSAPQVSLTQATCTVATGTINVTSTGVNTDRYSIDGTNYETSNVFSNVQPGTYPVTVKSAAGCVSGSTTAVLTAQPATPAAATISSSGSTVCEGTSVTLTSSASTGNQWYKDGNVIAGATGTSYSILQSGTYSVEVSNQVGCSSVSAGEVVVVNSKPSAAITQASGMNYANCGTSGPTITLTATTNASMPTYQWYKDGQVIAGASNSTYVANAVGLYTVEIAENGVCSNVSSSTKVNSAPSLNPPGTAVICSGDSFTFEANTNVQNPTYSWEYSTDGNTYSALNGATNSTFVAQNQGFYKVIINGTTASCPSELKVNALPSASITSSSGLSTCAGSMINLRANALANESNATIASFQWLKSNIMLLGQNSNTYTTNLGGDFKIQVTDSNGCMATSTVATVVVNQLPAAPQVSLTQATCTIATGTITVTPTGVNTDTYSIDGSNYQSSNVFANIQPGTYSVTVKSAAGCVSAATTAVLTSQPSTPSAPVVTLTQATCSVATGAISVTSTGVNSDTYSIDGNNYQSSNVFSNVQPGTYGVRVKSVNGCVSSATSAVLSPQPASPSLPTISSSGSTVCEGTTVTLTSSASSGNQWYKDGNILTGATSTTYSPTQSGNYTVQVTNNAGCSSVSSAEAVTVSPKPATSITQAAGMNYSNCGTTGPSITLTANSSTTAQSYVWYKDGQAISGATTSTYVASAIGLYTVEITDFNGCSNTSATSKVNSAPSLNPPGTATICAGDSFTFEANTSVQNPTYSWEFSTDGNTYSPIGGATNVTYAAQNQGFYKVMINGTTASCPAELKVNALPSATITSSSALAICAGTTISLNASTTANQPNSTIYSYQWSKSGVNLAGGTNQSFTTGIAGDYRVQVTDSNGCMVSSSLASVLVNPVPSAPQVTIVQPTCNTASGTITVANTGVNTDSYSIDGSNYQSSTIFANVTPGTYQVTIKSANGCISAATTVVITAQPASPTVTISSSLGTNICAGELTTFTASGTGNAPLTYQWKNAGSPINGETNSTFQTSSAGSYSVEVSDVNGCTNTSAASALIVNTRPSGPTVSLIQASCTIEKGTITITSSSNTGDTFSINGSTYQTSNIFANLDAGSYQVTVKSALGCTSAATLAVLTPRPVLAGTLSAISGALNPSAGSLQTYSVVALANVSGYHWTLPTGWSGTSSTNTIQVQIGTNPGNISVYAVSTGNCQTGTSSLAVEPNNSVLRPDFGIGTKGVLFSGDLSTNDEILSPLSYSNATLLSGSTTNATLVLHTNGTYSFVASVAGTYVYEVTVCPTGQTTGCKVSKLTCTIKESNNLSSQIIVNNDIATVKGGQSVTTAVLANDLCTGSTCSIDPLNVSIATAPTNGTAIILTDGSIKYTPNAGFVGTDVLTYQICTGPNTCSPSTVTYEVLPVNASPVTTVADDVAFTKGNAQVSGNVLSNDQSTQAGAQLHITQFPTVPASKGTITWNADGSYVFVPANNFVGNIDLTYTACDHSNPSICGAGTLHILVDPKPVANNDLIVSPTDSVFVANILANDEFQPGANVVLGRNTLNPGTAKGTVAFNPLTGVMTYQPSPYDDNSVTVTYSVCDNNYTPVQCGTATVTVVVCDPTNPVLDCDGDGVTNGQEALDGTDPSSPCSLNPSSITLKLQLKFLDLDCDGDGISNRIETNGSGLPLDTDWDGIPNYLDTDSDNDGINDSYEKNIDSDGDGVADYQDLDSDNDGIADKVEYVNDPDGDGIPNYLDLDSDGDGIKDAWEALAVFVYNRDDNYDGRIDKKGVFIDNNGNGWADISESDVPTDTDKDGTPDYLDLDSDNDCIPDTVEGTSDPDADWYQNYRDTDSDGDGIPDNVEAVSCTNPVDTDGDGKPDYMDLDSDNDFIPDNVEGILDSDGDGKPNYRDTDSDNDGLLDAQEVGKDPNNPVDTDGDGIPDFRDLDSDNDGVPDEIEAGKDPQHPVDTDGDGIPDYRDLDSDNDGIPDAIEAGKDPQHPVDTDGDGIPDFRDLDSDNDGIPDAIEAGKDPQHPVDTDGDGIPDFRDADADNDGITDEFEGMLDTDKDGILDYLDLDSDNDGISDKIEGIKDTDGDGIPNFRDTDSDNDGIPDKLEGIIDSDGDGIPNYLDTDSDGDGIADQLEGNSDTDQDGLPDYLDLDSDNDGYPDKLEGTIDTDKDGIPDFRDLDSDGDGILDKVENDIDFGGLPDCDGDGIDNRIDGDVCPNYATQGLSPNKDGINDFLVIPGVKSFKNHLTIFNRWGNMVFEVYDYQNDWGGQANRGNFVQPGDLYLPDGTYFYVLDFYGVKPSITNFVYINRNE